MKKLFTFIFIIIITTQSLIGCQQKLSKEQDYSSGMKSLDVREAVWNQLTIKQKKHIVYGKWNNANVRKLFLRDGMGIINDKTFIGKEVYLVGFPSNDGPSLGDYVIYADIKSHLVVGIGLRD